MSTVNKFYLLTYLLKNLLSKFGSSSGTPSYSAENLNTHVSLTKSISVLILSLMITCSGITFLLKDQFLQALTTYP